MNHDDPFYDIYQSIDTEAYRDICNAAGWFTEEELSDTESEQEQIDNSTTGERRVIRVSKLTDEEWEENKRQSSLGGEELATHISEMFFGEKERIRQPIIKHIFASEGCHCSKGKTCRRRTSSTHFSFFGQKTTNARSEILGLRMWETWGLQGSIFSEGSLRLRYEGGQGSSDLWQYPESLHEISGAEVRYCCRNDNLWLFVGKDCEDNARLLDVKFIENTIVQIVLYKYLYYKVTQVSGYSDTIPWGGSTYTTYYRMVEWQFSEVATFQTEAALDLWTSEYWKDYATYETGGVSQDLSGPLRGGVLRLIRG